MVVAWAGLYLLRHPGTPRIDRRPHEALGETLAGEAVKLLAPGARLIVIARDSTPYRVPACEAQLDGLLRAVRKAGKSVTELRKIRLDPLRLVAVPPGDFFDLLRLGRPDDVIVSLLGPPVLAPDQVAALGGRRPVVLAVCSGAAPAQIDLPGLFEQGLLTAAVISRPEAPARAQAASGRARFEQMFRWVTRLEVDTLPRPAFVPR